MEMSVRDCLEQLESPSSSNKKFFLAKEPHRRVDSILKNKAGGLWARCYDLNTEKSMVLYVKRWDKLIRQQ